MFSLDGLSQGPDSDGPVSAAAIAADRLLLEQADSVIRASPTYTVVTVGDRYGALTLGAIAAGAKRVRSFQDAFTGELALQENYDRFVFEGKLPVGRNAFRSVPLAPDLFYGAEVILMCLPESRSELEMYSRMIQQFASPTVQVFAGAHVKAIRSMPDEIMGEYFEDVSTVSDISGARVYLSRFPIPRRPLDVVRFSDYFLTERFDPELHVTVCAYPGTFASAKVSSATRFLIDHFDKIQVPPEGDRAPIAVDLGCGSGILATELLQNYPEFAVLAIDKSLSATRSTLATIRMNLPLAVQGNNAGQYIIRRENGLLQQERNSVDLIVCYPTAIYRKRQAVRLGNRLFSDATNALRPGGRILTVFQTDMRLGRTLERQVGFTKVLGRNNKYSVTETTFDGD